MTARIVEFPTTGSVEEDLRAALDVFCADRVTSGVPAPVVRAMQAPGASTVTTIIAGIHVSLPIQARRLTPPEIVSAWQQLRGSVERLEAVS